MQLGSKRRAANGSLTRPTKRSCHPSPKAAIHNRAIDLEKRQSIRAGIENDLDCSTLIPIFAARVPARIAGVVDMITDGIVSSDHLSLADLVTMYSLPRPDLTRFKEGQDNAAPTPKDGLLDDIETFRAVIAACQDVNADSGMRIQAKDPLITARSWEVFVQRAASLPLEMYLEAIQAIHSDALKSIMNLPNSDAKAKCATELACSASKLDERLQSDAFRTAVALIIDNIETVPSASHDKNKLALYLSKCASSLSRLHNSTVTSCICYLVGRVDKSARNASPQVHASIAQAVGLDPKAIRKWHDHGRLSIEIRKHIKRRCEEGLSVSAPGRASMSI